MKPLLFLLIAITLGCSKHNYSNALSGSWSFEEYVGGIPYVPLANRLDFTGTAYIFHHYTGSTESGTYELINQFKCGAQEGFTKQILYHRNPSHKEYIKIIDRKLHINFGCSGLGVIYRKN